MKSLTTVLLLSAAVAAGCSGDSPVGVDTGVLVSGPHQAVTMVPFEGRHSALSDPGIAPACPTGATPGASTIIEGSATELGTFTGNAISCATGLHFDAASLTWIGANGDEVRLSLDLGAEQPFVIVGPVLTFTSEFDITGGTGRFDGATGHVVIATRFQLDGVGPNQSTWEGTISSPGSNKYQVCDYGLCTGG